MPARPDAPPGVRDLNSLPWLPSDSRLHELRSTLRDELTDAVFDDLSKLLPPDEPAPEPTDDYRARALSYVDTCLDYRDRIRPDSLRELADLPEDVTRTTVGNWVWYESATTVEHTRPETDATVTDGGKFLLFAPGEARPLETVVLAEFTQRPLTLSKLPTTQGKQDDWVLCLYHPDNRYWYDVRNMHHDPPRVRFRGYKTEDATKRGEYSERFENAR
jgi:hypothetical protein